MSDSVIESPLPLPDLSTKSARVQWVMDELERLYPVVPVPLGPHRPYTLLVAVLLSAQCTDERVNTVTPALFARADNPKHMRNVPVDEVREIIRPCGLSPQKSKAIVRLSEILMDEHGGEVPQDMEALERLPRGSQDRIGGDVPGVRCPRLPGGHPHPPFDVPLEFYQRQRTSSRPSATPSVCFRKTAGTSCTCRSSSTVANTAGTQPCYDRDFITRTIGRKSEVAKLEVTRPMAFFSNDYPDRMPLVERIGKELRFRKAVKASNHIRVAQFVLVHPDWPSKRASIMAYADALQWVVTNRPDTPTQFNGVIVLKLAFDDRTEKRQAQPILNGHCLDISKSTLDRHHQAVFGYGLNVDPTSRLRADAREIRGQCCP